MTLLNRVDAIDAQIEHLKSFLTENEETTAVSEEELQMIMEDSKTISELKSRMEKLKNSNVYGKGSNSC